MRARARLVRVGAAWQAVLAVALTRPKNAASVRDVVHEREADIVTVPSPSCDHEFSLMCAFGEAAKVAAAKAKTQLSITFSAAPISVSRWKMD